MQNGRRPWLSPWRPTAAWLVAGLFAAVGENAKFYGLILPHGLLELSAIVVAGAAGNLIDRVTAGSSGGTKSRQKSYSAGRSIV